MPPEAQSDEDREGSRSVALEAPSGAEFEPLVRIILGGIAARADMGFDELDDLQLAVERLLAEAGADGRIRLTFDIRPGSVRTRVGPLLERKIADALQGEESPPGELGLRRVLATVVDSFGVESSDGDGGVVVRLEKRVRNA